jgi:hypothetical protein
MSVTQEYLSQGLNKSSNPEDDTSLAKFETGNFEEEQGDKKSLNLESSQTLENSVGPSKEKEVVQTVDNQQEEADEE